MQSLFSRLAPQRNVRKLEGGFNTTKTYQGFAFFTLSPPEHCHERWNRNFNPHQQFAVFRWFCFCKQAGQSCCHQCHKDIRSWVNNGVTKFLQRVPCLLDRSICKFPNSQIWVNQGCQENHQSWNHIFTLQYVSRPPSCPVRWWLPAETWWLDTCW